MNLSEKIATLRHFANTYWARRIGAEIAVTNSVSHIKGDKYAALIEKTVDSLFAKFQANGNTVTEADARDAEQALMPAAADVKSYKLRCVAHAHIDMNWQWGFQETAAISVDTFRTMLDLLAEYPDFTFAQSQASTYKIIEEYCPEMLPEIAKYVHEGRWELSASQWVETDKNMPNGESLCRHILYTKKYLSELFDVSEDSMQLDFEPDTFGHNITVPEILSEGGVRYYYHCRGYDGYNVYNWKARSGESVLVYRDPSWYNVGISEDIALNVPAFCNEAGIDTALCAYGVGDHGGGPSRRDVERIIDYGKWPLYPEVTFGTYHGFFREIEKFKDTLPTVEGELNFVFTGCYTSQSRIKGANRFSEARLYDAEALGTAAKMYGGRDYTKQFAGAWQKCLFNHFHDILPGSGVVDTREYAMGQFQQVMAAANTASTAAMKTLAANIDTSGIETFEDKNTASEGAGVGSFVNQGSHYQISHVERGMGRRRILHLFNTSEYDFEGVTELTVWNWEFDPNRATLTDLSDDSPAAIQCTAANQGHWGYGFHRFAAKVKVPALGYATYLFDEAPMGGYYPAYGKDQRADYIDDNDIVMENDKIKAVFDHQTAELLSLTDKTTGKLLIDEPSCTFRLITESTVNGMTSWRVGNYMKIKNLNESENVRVNGYMLGGMRKSINYTLSFGRSNLNVTVFLNDGSSTLDFDVTADFHEVGNGGGIPQLNFIAPLAYAPTAYRCDVPFGTIDRPALRHDVPANSFICALPEDGCGVMLLTDSKYGYRGDDNSVAVDLIRGSCDPDPYPEYGVHNIRVGVAVVPCACSDTLFRTASAYLNAPKTVSVRKNSGGKLPLSGSFMKVDGAKLSAVKCAEDGDGIVVRVCDICGDDGEFTLTFAETPACACLSDINENRGAALAIDGKRVRAAIGKYKVETVRVKF